MSVQKFKIFKGKKIIEDFISQPAVIFFIIEDEKSQDSGQDVARQSFVRIGLLIRLIQITNRFRCFIESKVSSGYK